jgi:hypothetical protein
VRNNFGASAVHSSASSPPNRTNIERVKVREAALSRVPSAAAVWDQAILEFLGVRPAKSRFR